MKPRLSRREIENALKVANGNVAQAARAVDRNPQYFAKFIAEDPGFRRLLDSIRRKNGRAGCTGPPPAIDVARLAKVDPTGKRKRKDLAEIFRCGLSAVARARARRRQAALAAIEAARRDGCDTPASIAEATGLHIEYVTQLLKESETT